MKAQVEELIRVYRASLLLANASAVDTTRDQVDQGSGGHGTHGERGRMHSFGQDVPLAVELERALERFVTVYRRRLEAEAQGASGRPSHDRVGAAKRAEDDAILRAVGEDPTALAFLYGRTTEGVRKLRQRRGLDPDTGERVPRDLLTAPAPRRPTTSPSLSPTTTTED